jgi:hypothetical protein
MISERRIVAENDLDRQAKRRLMRQARDVQEAGLWRCGHLRVDNEYKGQCRECRNTRSRLHQRELKGSAEDHVDWQELAADLPDALADWLHGSDDGGVSVG